MRNELYDTVVGRRPEGPPLMQFTVVEALEEMIRQYQDKGVALASCLTAVDAGGVCLIVVASNEMMRPILGYIDAASTKARDADTKPPTPE